MAVLTLSLHLMDENRQLYKDFSWRNKVLCKTGIHPQWLAELETSVVGDFSVPRVSGIIDLTQCEFHRLIPLLSTFNMPMVLHWGLATDFPLFLPTNLEKLAPDKTQRSILAQAELDAYKSYVINNKCYPKRLDPIPIINLHPLPSSTSCATGSSSDARPSTFPPVEKGSGQRAGEDWKSFFACRAVIGLELGWSCNCAL
jgi:hypothetical protein